MEETAIPVAICPSCQHTADSASYFCSYCGKPLKSRPLSTSIGKQLLMYTVSIILPPFGIRWGIQYMKQEEQKARIIGGVVIALNIISFAVSVVILIQAYQAYVATYSHLLDQVNGF